MPSDHLSGARVQVNAVIQARVGSTRLPGKVLQPLAGRSVLEWVVRAARAADGIDDVIVATSTADADDDVRDLAKSLQVPVFRGSEDDVLDRFVQAVVAHPCDAVVRLTADCPLLDPRLIALVAMIWRHYPDLDYVATTLKRTLPRGLDVEVAGVRALRELHATVGGHDRAHVTSGLYGHPERFALLGVVVAPDASDLRVTLDTVQDARALEAVVAEIGDRPPSWRELVELLRSHPEIVALNSTVDQKPIEAG